MADPISDRLKTKAEFLAVLESNENPRMAAQSVEDALNVHVTSGGTITSHGIEYNSDLFDPVSVSGQSTTRQGSPVVAFVLETPFPSLSFLNALKTVIERDGVRLERLSVLDANMG